MSRSGLAKDDLTAEPVKTSRLGVLDSAVMEDVAVESFLGLLVETLGGTDTVLMLLVVGMIVFLMELAGVVV